MKKLIKRLFALVGLLAGLVVNHQAWSQSPCSPLAEKAGLYYQVMDKHFALPLNQVLPDNYPAQRLSRVGVWQVYLAEQPVFSQQCALQALDKQGRILAFPVFKKRFETHFAVFSGRFLIQANDVAKFERWQSQFSLQPIMRIEASQSAIFQALLDQDFVQLLDRLERQVGVEAITPLLSEQRYQPR